MSIFNGEFDTPTKGESVEIVGMSYSEICGVLPRPMRYGTNGIGICYFTGIPKECMKFIKDNGLKEITFKDIVLTQKDTGK